MILRGSKINYANKLGKTALYIAIEHHVSEDMIKFLISAGAKIHVEALDEKDCCDIAVQNKYYTDMKIFWNRSCRNDPKLRLT